MNQEPLPEMLEAVLGAAQLAALAGEVDAGAEGLVASTKGGAEVRSAEGGDLTAAQSARMLAAGQAVAVQWRYAHQGVKWADTVLGHGNGKFKLLRMRIPMA